MAKAIPIGMSSTSMPNPGDSPLPFANANLGTSARAASPIPGVYDGAGTQSSKKIDKSIEPMKHQGRGLLRVIGNDELDAAEKRSIDLSKVDPEVTTDLANYIRQRFEKAVRHRRVIAVDDELIRDMRAYNGQYDRANCKKLSPSVAARCTPV